MVRLRAFGAEATPKEFGESGSLLAKAKRAAVGGYIAIVFFEALGKAVMAAAIGDKIEKICGVGV